MKNDGKDAEQAFVDYWTRIGHVQRFRDKRDLSGLNKGARLADFSKPSDFIVSSKDHPLHYAEVKSTTDATSFSFGKIQKGQNAAALSEARRGHGSYVFYIYSYPLGEWFIMDCLDYNDLCNAGRRSVKFKELKKWMK